MLEKTMSCRNTTIGYVDLEAYLARPRNAAGVARIDEIFFVSSAVQQFSGAAERAAFRERWLGRYLLVDAEHAFIAIDRDRDTIVGYVIGSIADPARQPRFADLASVGAFSAASARFPAHLHINIDPAYRNRGIGERLIDAFGTHAQACGAVGMHVVTSAASRNVRFYRRCGFEEIARLPSGGGDKVFLGRGFPASAAPAIKSRAGR